MGPVGITLTPSVDLQIKVLSDSRNKQIIIIYLNLVVYLFSPNITSTKYT